MPTTLRVDKEAHQRVFSGMRRVAKFRRERNDLV